MASDNEIIGTLMKDYPFVLDKNIVYFDLETKETASDVGGWDKKCNMGMSVGVTYSAKHDKYDVFLEDQVNELVETLKRADMVVGYNVINFDYEVLMGYVPIDLYHVVETKDLLLDIKNSLGRKVPLNSVAQGTLGVGKTSEGLQAIKWWREAKIQEIIDYCKADVQLTYLLHQHGLKHGELKCRGVWGEIHNIPLDWDQAQTITQ